MSEKRPGPRRRPPLPLGWRIFFLVSGWLIILLGVAGLALPGLQGILTLVIGGALLSLSSHTAYRAIRWMFRCWPRGWRRLEKLRRRVYRALEHES